MIETAEIVSRRYNISREEQDVYSYISQKMVGHADLGDQTDISSVLSIDYHSRF